MSQPDEPTPARPYKKLFRTGRIVQYPVKRRQSVRARKVWHDPPQPFEIAALRKQLGLSFRKFADVMGVCFAEVYKWEVGETKMNNGVIPLFREMQNLSDHVLQRRAKPDWTL